MSQDRYPLPDKPSQTPTAWAASVQDGLTTIETFYSGTTDPSTGHAWGADQVGIVWKDTTTAYDPAWKEWAKIGPGGTDYGWRPLGMRKEVHVADGTAGEPLVFAPASPRNVDVGDTDYDLSTILDTLQGSLPYHRVSEVLLRVRVTMDAAETRTGDDCYIGFRAKGADLTCEKRVYGVLPACPAEADVWVPLDANEVLTWNLKVGGGAPNLIFEAWVVGWKEPY